MKGGAKKASEAKPKNAAVAKESDQRRPLAFFLLSFLLLEARKRLSNDG